MDHEKKIQNRRTALEKEKFSQNHKLELSQKIYDLINKVWKTHLLNQKGDFRKAMIALVDHLSEKKLL